MVIQFHSFRSPVRYSVGRFGKGADWFDIYKTLECLYKRAGGEHEFLALNWEPENEIKRLRVKANWFRHARHKNDRLENQMTQSDARALLGQLLQRALRHSFRRRA